MMKLSRSHLIHACLPRVCLKNSFVIDEYSSLYQFPAGDTLLQRGIEESRLGNMNSIFKSFLISWV